MDCWLLAGFWGVQVPVPRPGRPQAVHLSRTPKAVARTSSAGQAAPGRPPRFAQTDSACAGPFLRFPTSRSWSAQTSLVSNFKDSLFFFPLPSSRLCSLPPPFPRYLSSGGEAPWLWQCSRLRRGQPSSAGAGPWPPPDSCVLYR